MTVTCLSKMQGERRNPAIRGSLRGIKNLCFSIIMILQVSFWVYVLLPAFTQPLKEEDFIHRQFRQIDQEQQKHREDAHPSVNPLKQPKSIRGMNKFLVESLRDVVPVKQPHAGYIKDLNTFLKDNNMIKEEKKEPVQLDKATYQKYFNSMLHHTILPRDSSVIWNGSFLKNPSTICNRYSDLDLLIIVHTAPYNFKRRSMIRQEIGNSIANRPYSVQPVFMIGSMKEKEINTTNEIALVAEFSQFADIVKMDFVEDFRNLSLKALMWLKWTNRYCRNTKMILKIDDDVVIDMKRILPLSRGLFTKYTHSIFCHLNKIGSQPIPRRGRTEVDPREFMRMAFYPYNYCSGFIVFLTPDLIPLLEETARRIPFYNVDDVFMFGMIPRFIGDVTYHNIGFNVSVWNKKVLRCSLEKRVQCPYFGTMGEEEEDRLNVWNAIRNNHKRDFHFPQMHIIK